MYPQIRKSTNKYKFTPLHYPQKTTINLLQKLSENNAIESANEKNFKYNEKY